MNNHMYEHAATRANLQTLRERGVTVLEPGSGRLASKGEQGIGRLAEPAAAAGRLRGRARRAPLGAARTTARRRAGADAWAGVRVLVTAGGTREPIDSVRFLGNSSSGRMGLALAEAALARGAEVTLVAANVALPRSAAIARRDVVHGGRAAAGLRGAVRRLRRAADGGRRRRLPPGRGARGQDQEVRSREPGAGARADRRRARGARRRSGAPGQTLVGFAAEHGERRRRAARARSSTRRASTRSSSTTSRARTSALTPTQNEVTILTGATAPAATPSSRSARARQGAGRRGDPRRRRRALPPATPGYPVSAAARR